MYRIGIDVGGTFTDFTVLRDTDGAVRFFKVPSTPADPSAAIQDGLRQIIAAFAVDPAAIVQLGHGTTVATNMIIERRGAHTGLLTTKGFRDVIEIGRQVRPSLYDYTVRKPVPLVARRDRIEIDERITFDGSVLRPLDEAEVGAAAHRLKEAGVGSVAICFLHSYRNPAHEEAARRIVEAVLPDAYVSTSFEVLPEFREYERLSTTVLNAYVGPRMGRYLEGFLTRTRALGITVEPHTIHSNGGLLSVRSVIRLPVRTCLSGPAAGVVGAAAVGAAAGRRDLVTFDVGGTSTDVSLIKDGRPLFTSHRTVADHPVKTPMIDIHVIGAGGGSIGWLDEAGALKVGPHSAGADPGPAAYGRGGRDPTLTDANIVLHRLNPVALLRGKMPVDFAAAHRAIEERIARPLGLTVEAAAHGMLEIANSAMGRAIRAVSTERGHDIGAFALFAYGGAGPLHAADVARECGIREIIVPQEPGTMCARGILLSESSLDFVRSKILIASPANWAEVQAAFAEMAREGEAWLAQEKVPEERRVARHFIDARYLGQNHEVVVPLPGIAPDGLDNFIAAFRHAHRVEYGYDVHGRDIEIVNCRLQAAGKPRHAPLRAGAGADVAGADVAGADAGRVERRRVHFGAEGWLDAPVHQRESLPVGTVIAGPAVIEEMSSTTLVMPGQSARVDTVGNILLAAAASPTAPARA
ncbi:MAG: hydantoinase/oxoprolinase family protein [Alphaproteobacteria bacterium]|nr:hydantoinase/oxoprolinase family protein [Alphaproteobacteria bacterium]